MPIRTAGAFGLPSSQVSAFDPLPTFLCAEAIQSFVEDDVRGNISWLTTSRSAFGSKAAAHSRN